MLYVYYIVPFQLHGMHKPLQNNSLQDTRQPLMSIAMQHPLARCRSIPLAAGAYFVGVCIIPVCDFVESPHSDGHSPFLNYLMAHFAQRWVDSGSKKKLGYLRYKWLCSAVACKELRLTEEMCSATGDYNGHMIVDAFKDELFQVAQQ